MKTQYNNVYNSLFPIFLSENPRNFAIFGLQWKIPADFHATNHTLTAKRTSFPALGVAM